MAKSNVVMNLVVKFMFFAVLLAAGGVFPLSGISAKAQTVGSAQDYLGTAEESYRKGDLGAAALHWTEAARLYEKAGNVQGQTQALVYLGQSLKHMGQTKKAIMTLEVARDLAKREQDGSLMIRILGSIGNTYFLLGKEENAIDYLTQGLELARIEELSVQTAVLLNDLGNVQFAVKKYHSALEAYIESALIAENTGNVTLSVFALINAAMTEIKENLFKSARERLELAFSKIQSVSDSHDKVQGLLKIGLAYDDLRTSQIQILSASNPAERKSTGTLGGKRGLGVTPEYQGGEPQKEMEEPGKDEPSFMEEESPGLMALLSHRSIFEGESEVLLNKSVKAFQQAISLAKSLGDERAESYGQGYLGHVHEKENHLDEALTHTRQALHIGQKISAPELVYRWQWQIARVHRKIGDVDKAIMTYRLALNTLSPIRQELLEGYQGRRPPFRKGVGSLYFELVDLILQKASMNLSPRESEGYLRQAQNIVEEFNAAELQDYFRDQCVERTKTQSLTLENISKDKRAAIIYPIILPDRLELLVSLPDGLKTYRVAVKEHILTREVRKFRDSLEDEVHPSAKILTHAQQIYDWLIGPIYKDLMAASINVLVFVPDGPLRTIPLAPLYDRSQSQYLIDQFPLAITPGLTLTDLRPMDSTKISILGLGLSETVRGFLSLPWVNQEMSKIQTFFPSKILLNEEFQVANMDRELKSREYNVVHIATHGKVQPIVMDSFVQAFDKKITMDHLAEMIGVFKYGAQPLELLTLSACETAAGDDRAALGLAGIAIKAGAKSALASLWPIDDESTSILVAEFYRQLSKENAPSKAVALQQAQRSLRNHPKFQHPSFWSPFLLIGNWF